MIKNWLDKKMPIRIVFLKTQKEKKERFYKPYQWADFILIE